MRSSETAGGASTISGPAERSEAITGRATHQVVGGPGGVPEAVFRRLVVEAGAVAAPVVEGTVTVPLPGAADPTVAVKVTIWLLNDGDAEVPIDNVVPALATVYDSGEVVDEP